MHGHMNVKLVVCSSPFWVQFKTNVTSHN